MIKYFYLTHGTLKGTIPLNEGVLTFLKAYLSAEMQLVYSTVLADSADNILTVFTIGKNP